jgi:hypothetical protein
MTGTLFVMCENEVKEATLEHGIKERKDCAARIADL